MASVVSLTALAITALSLLLQFTGTLCQVGSSSLSLSTDRDALISFKSQITLQPQSPLLSWNETGSSSPCNWTGVICNRFSNRVIALNLSGFGLAGSISPSLGNLSFLRSLQLQNNKLKGLIPNQITNLFQLRVLNVSSNSLEGFLPSNASKLVELEILDLSSNRLAGTIPNELGDLRKLKVLNLARNLLNGAIPPSLSNVSTLTTLNLGTNSLNGPIPGDLSRLGNLQNLDLTINNLSGTVPSSIYNMSSLVSLALASNNLWGDIPYDVGVRLPKLLVFNFCINKFTGGIPGSLHNLTNIRVIRMAHNLLEGTVPPGLGNLPFLEMYNIGYNKIVGSGKNGLDFITSLTNSSRLSFLAIDGNRFEGEIPESIGDLTKNLSKLYMGENRFSGRIPDSISRLTGLTLLNMSFNSLTGEIPSKIGDIQGLQVLNLAQNNLSGRIPESLGGLSRLNEIDMSGNNLEGEIPSSFGKFQSLLSMDLSDNGINGSIPREVLDLPSLSTVLNLSNNFLSGPIPQDIGRLESVVTIDLSENQFTGNIPVSVKNCKSLEKLSMRGNSFSGLIPDAIAEVKGLESLDLSSNRLSGLIPFKLRDLQALKFLNLSYNNFEGGIPNEGIFRNASAVHLEGNPKLCLKVSCRKKDNHGKIIKISIAAGVAGILALCVVVFLIFRLRKTKSIVPSSSNLRKDPVMTVSYDQLRRATNNFSDQNLIGTGSFGSVYKGVIGEGITVAIKVINTRTKGYYKSFVAECEALRNVRHRNLVKLITSCSSLDFKNTEFLALVYEFLGNGNLDDWIKGKKKKSTGEGMNLDERIGVAIDVASGLDYLHNDCDVPVVHCDLKPSNVVLDDDMTAKVADFGLARLLMDSISCEESISSTHVLKGSIGYIPPEYGFGEKPTTAGDVYSFGVMLLELVTGRSPTQECFAGEQSLIRWVETQFPENLLQIVDPQLAIDDSQKDCLVRVVSVGLCCTQRCSDARMGMRDALRKLKAAKAEILKRRTG